MWSGVGSYYNLDSFSYTVSTKRKCNLDLAISDLTWPDLCRRRPIMRSLAILLCLLLHAPAAAKAGLRTAGARVSRMAVKELSSVTRKKSLTPEKRIDKDEVLRSVHRIGDKSEFVPILYDFTVSIGTIS